MLCGGVEKRSSKAQGRCKVLARLGGLWDKQDAPLRQPSRRSSVSGHDAPCSWDLLES